MKTFNKKVQNMYIENYKILLREKFKDLYKLRDIPY